MMLMTELEKSYPLVYEALNVIASDNGCTSNQSYEFPGCVVPTIVISQRALEQLSGRKVADVISIDDVPAVDWGTFCDDNALETAVCSEEYYMVALCAAIDGGDVLSRFLSACFDGMYSRDAFDRQLLQPVCDCAQV